MAKCIHCDSETLLFFAGKPICIVCDSKREVEYLRQKAGHRTDQPNPPDSTSEQRSKQSAAGQH